MRLFDLAICAENRVHFDLRRRSVLCAQCRRARRRALGQAVGEEVLHLKTAVTHIDETTLVAPDDATGDRILHAMRTQLDELDYTVVRLPDLQTCNLVSLVSNSDRDRTILAFDTTCETSRRILHETVVEQRGYRLEFVDTSELAKKDGGLTCCSILL